MKLLLTCNNCGSMTDFAYIGEDVYECERCGASGIVNIIGFQRLNPVPFSIEAESKYSCLVCAHKDISMGKEPCKTCLSGTTQFKQFPQFAQNDK